jgi:hypothetical protein
MDDELRAFLTQRFEELRRELTERSETLRRELGVVIERQQDQIRLIAEGHATLLAAIERMQRENEAEHRETRAMIKLSYAELERRVTRLETLVVDLEARLTRLELER